MTAERAPSTVRIREASPRDAEALAALAARTFSETFLPDNEAGSVEQYVAVHFGPEVQRAELHDRAMLTLVAEDDEDGALMAYAQLRAGGAVPAGVEYARPVELKRFYVDRPWHGKGLARPLMDACTRTAAALGANAIWLGVWERNARAVAFYERCGFRIAGTLRFAMGEEEQRDHLMVRPLNGTLELRGNGGSPPP